MLHQLPRTPSLHNIEHDESERLGYLGGFLMIYKGRYRIVLSKHLSSADKQRGLEHLLQHFTETPNRNACVILWHPYDGDMSTKRRTNRDIMEADDLLASCFSN